MMNSLISNDLSNLTLPRFDPGSSQRDRTDRKRLSEDRDSLLYETYDDYFNMEEEVTSKTFNNPSPLSPSPESEKLSVSTNLTSPFFFVLSATSPISPSMSETGFTPVSPLKPSDIPEALANLLPQPSNSLLKVINVAQSGSFPEKQGERTHQPSNAEFVVQVKERPLPEPPGAPTSSSSPRRTPSSSRPDQPQLRDCSAAVPMSLALMDPLNLPGSSIAEVSSSLRRLPDPTGVHDPPTRVTYHESIPSSPTPHSPSLLRPRVREARSMDVVSSTPKGIQSTRGHVRGRSSPFPIPIQFDFAPASVLGSTTTPYSYF
ncbi:hypothetical protein D9756_009215 [Leucocoprinus leucothites]|uniref:Uncharacterized protein n=1 Tax=Leucocoprinus leucothites TaxID=201217 RepID=A0A8H5CY17_9AGAR|nr:hypothetical protein D9756_009215 [Leucoagaricus leucothites]